MRRETWFDVRLCSALSAFYHKIDLYRFVRITVVAIADTLTHFASHSDCVPKPYRHFVSSILVPMYRFRRRCCCDELFFVLVSRLVCFAHTTRAGSPQSQIHQKRITTAPTECQQEAKKRDGWREQQREREKERAKRMRNSTKNT